MRVIRPEIFLIIISVCSVFAWELEHAGWYKGSTAKNTTTKAQPTVDHEALLAEKDEEIRNLKAALEEAKVRLAGTTRFLQQARTIDLKAESRKKNVFRKINEKFRDKARKIKLQLKRIAQILNQKRHRLTYKIKKLIGKAKYH